MSNSRGNISRKRPQKHQNKTVFKNDLHDTSHKTKFINSLEITGVCKRCKDIIDWKIKYKKYKPLTAPRKCVGCEQKAIKYAYHLLCTKCVTEKNVCAKCCKPVEIEEKDVTTQGDTDIQQLLKGLPERKRRSLLRYINKQGGEQKITAEMLSYIDDVLAGVDKLHLEDDLDSDFEEET
ncbi:uncharacterized protein C9orf85 homolog [Amyelois transitella]|uniref:uncharacterized protein C9orf85 homolog n=1 Tax=Amyelois transitella TaxID=680683 RepID=UPI00298FA7CA|nr:uncharacterized protein C9orf85 homolog [Amyelois transitella]XP_013195420.2 uncharacterized protein C9orf85 homolog [Amyelois transitella]